MFVTCYLSSPVLVRNNLILNWSAVTGSKKKHNSAWLFDKIPNMRQTFSVQRRNIYLHCTTNENCLFDNSVIVIQYNTRIQCTLYDENDFMM